MAEKALCRICDCGKPAKSKGLCWSHYNRLKRHGDPKGGGVSRGEIHSFLKNIVFNYQEDECLFWPYGRDKDGYARLWINGRAENAHRVVCRSAHGDAPTGRHQAAHSCGNGHLGCVSPKHLRWATPSENCLDRNTHGTQWRGGNRPAK